MKLYHITKEKYITSILTEGLKINSGKDGFCKSNVHKLYKSQYGMQQIFLTNDIEFISKKMLTNCWIKQNNEIVIKIDVHLNEINSSEGYYLDTINGIEPKKFRYFLNIEPKQIEVVNMNFGNFELKY